MIWLTRVCIRVLNVFSNTEFDLSGQTPIYLGVDMGGTRIKCGLVRRGAVIASHVFSAQSERSIIHAMNEIKQVSMGLLEKHQLSISDCRGVGWGFPAIVEPGSSQVLGDFKKYKDVAGFDFDHWTRREMGLPSAIDNDARLALIGEWQHGAAQGCAYAAIVTLGTGVGTSVIFNNQPLRGPNGSAGNLGGHTTAIAGGQPCFCGIDGCYESETGSKALPVVAARLPGYDSSALAQEPTIDYAAVFRLADDGDACALALRDRNIGLWANLCFDLSRHFNVSRIVVGGGVMRRADIILPVLQQFVDKEPFIVGNSPRIVASSLHDEMALMGVPWLVEERLESK